MKKKELVAAFISHLEKELVLLKQAALATYDAATNEESKPENEYDTRALEASYLAGAQAKRVGEIEDVLKLFRSLAFKEFGTQDGIAVTALIDLELDGQPNTVLMMPSGGGVNLSHAGLTVQIVTPSSALGETLLGLKVGDSAEFEVGSRTRECEILGVQ